MRSPGRRHILAAAAAALIAGSALFGAAQASAHHDAGHPPDLQAFDAEFTAALGETDRADSQVFILAHAGQLSPKDGCHRHKAAGERHWHQGNTAERGGECVKQDGVSYRVMEVEAEPAPPALPWVVCSGTWRDLHEEVGGYWAPSISDAAKDLLACLTRAYTPEE